MAGIVIERVGLGATVQDLGRPGCMHEGIPPGGPLVRELLLAANRSLGNGDSAAALELPLHACTVRAEGDLTLSVSGVLRGLRDGEALTVEPGMEAVHYLALPGGIDVPMAVGARGTLLAATLGGLQGRILRRGDRLQALASVPLRFTEVRCPPLDESLPIQLSRGPDFTETDLFEQLLSQPFRISPLQDRVGTRLEGARLRRLETDRQGSFPMVRGAIQVTTDGSLIVLGPDHPTTGGYPVVGVVMSAHLDAFARRRPGTEVRFEEAHTSHRPIL